MCDILLLRLAKRWRINMKMSNYRSLQRGLLPSYCSAHQGTGLTWPAKCQNPGAEVESIQDLGGEIVWLKAEQADRGTGVNLLKKVVHVVYNHEKAAHGVLKTHVSWGGSLRFSDIQIIPRSTTAESASPTCQLWTWLAGPRRAPISATQPGWLD